jgi:hypothetical protein
VIDGGFDADNVFVSSKVKSVSGKLLKKEAFHGSHVLGTICGDGAMGVAQHCDVSVHLASTVCGAATSELSSVELLEDDIEKIMKKFEKQGVRVVSRSMGINLGGGIGKDETKSFRAYSNSGKMIVVNAAGNDWADLDHSSDELNPDELIIVTSIGPSGIVSDFSNYGKVVVLAAPGEDIFSISALDLNDEEQRKASLKSINYSNPNGKSGQLIAMNQYGGPSRQRDRDCYVECPPAFN